MTESEVRPWLDRWVRVTLADGRVLAGRLGHHGGRYSVTTPAPDKRERDVVERMKSDQIATIEEAREFGR